MMPHDLKFYVYVLKRPCGTPFYVGMGSGNRVGKHEGAARCGEVSRRANVIRKIWSTGGSVVRSIVARYASDAEAKAAECILIAQIGRLDTSKGPLVNHTDGGEGASGLTVEMRKILGEKTRRGMATTVVRDQCKRHAERLHENDEWSHARAEEIREYWRNPDHRAAQSERTARFAADNPEKWARDAIKRIAGQARPEVREKMRAAKLGKKQSPEHIAKRAAALSKPRREGTGQRISEAKRAAFARRRAEAIAVTA